MTREIKTFPAVLKTVDEADGIVEALAAVMGNIDHGNDIIHNGAFTKTLAERGHKVRVLDNHRADSVMHVLGRPLEIREIGAEELPASLRAQYPDATGGLYTRTQFFLDTPEGMGAFLRIKNGGIDEYSIAFTAYDVDFTPVTIDGVKTSVRNIRTVKLYEYSPVVFAMNEATTTVAAKALAAEDVRTWINETPMDMELRKALQNVLDTYVMPEAGPQPETEAPTDETDNHEAIKARREALLLELRRRALLDQLTTGANA